MALPSSVVWNLPRTIVAFRVRFLIGAGLPAFSKTRGKLAWILHRNTELSVETPDSGITIEIEISTSGEPVDHRLNVPLSQHPLHLCGADWVELPE